MTPAQRNLLVVVAATLGVDLATKAWATASLDAPIDIGGSLSLQLGYNPGVAFGAGQSLPSWVLLALTATLCTAIAVAGWRGALGPPVAVGLVLGGASGNFLDRLTGGSVVDMIHLTWWPTFNAADAAICAGVAVIVVRSLLPERSTPEAAARPEWEDV